MKVAPVSADLLIKLALAAAVVGGAWYMARRARAAIDGVLPDWTMPDLGAWVDGAGRFVGDVGSTVGDGARWAADSLGGTAHNTDPATWNLPPLDNPYGVYLTLEQRKVYDAAVERGTVFGDVWGFITRIGNQVPDPIRPSDPVRDIRRIDNALGY